MLSPRSALILCLLTFGTQAAPDPDEILSLPGLGSVSFRQFSGYLPATTGTYLHYWLVESQRAPKSDPLVVWLNGGPGCSSLMGLLEEHGPFRVRYDGRGLNTNKHSWNKIANVLYIESPAGVGFSYSTSQNYTTNDNQVADDNMAALRSFLTKFPGYKGRSLFLAGESYAGIYVPTLASRVVDHPSFNFKGFAVGNGVTDWALLNDSLVYFAYYHGLIGTRMWKDILGSCCQGMDTFRCGFNSGKVNNTNCETLFNNVYSLVWEAGLNPYNLYSECAGGATGQALPSLHELRMRGHVSAKPSNLSPTHMPTSDRGDVATPPCTNSTTTIIYLNSADVRRALHIPQTVKDWGPCSTTVSAAYRSTYTNVKKEYHKILSKGHRILVYNGDADMACNFLGDHWFVESLQLEEIGKFRAWYYISEDGSREVAGQVQDYAQLTFVTIRGAGHFVPTDKPIPAYDMFERFIRNQPY